MSRECFQRRSTARIRIENLEFGALHTAEGGFARIYLRFTIFGKLHAPRAHAPRAKAGGMSQL
jgi:hypothetical protein